MKSVCERFPEWSSEVEPLYQEDVDFQEMCQDHEQVLAILAAWETQPKISADAVEEYRVMLTDLETEIMDSLQARYGAVE